MIRFLEAVGLGLAIMFGLVVLVALPGVIGVVLFENPFVGYSLAAMLFVAYLWGSEFLKSRRR